MQRKVDVVGDKLRLVFTYGDDIPKYTKYAGVIEYNKKMDSLEKTEIGKQEESRKKEEEIWQQLRKLESGPTSAPIKVTVKELASAYESSEEEADAKFESGILEVTGLVDRIEVKKAHNIHCITLSDNKKLLQSVWCMFDKEHEDELDHLTKGQLVTVRGEFDGSAVQLRVRHCVLVR
jgi:DNA polymerase III alpha subunit (gram-positive type)